MKKAVAHVRFVYAAGLRVGDVERLVIGMSVGFLAQILVEREYVIHQAELELLYVFAFTLSAHELAPRFEEIFERDDILVCMSEFLDHKATPPPHDFCLFYRA